MPVYFSGRLQGEQSVLSKLDELSFCELKARLCRGCSMIIQAYPLRIIPEAGETEK